MDQAAVENISKALGLPRPFLHERNRAFTQLESWQQLTALLATQPVRVSPLGYYRTPDSVDIYVFQCTMGTLEDGQQRSWKFYRRYRHFQRYITHSTELLASCSVRVPRLSQAYMKIFHAQHCRDRLVELHAWLTDVAENTQAYCRQLQHTQEEQAQQRLQELQRQRLEQLEERKARAKSQRHRRSIAGSVVSASSRASTPSTKSRRLRPPAPTTVEDDAALWMLRTAPGEALPVLMLSCFLLAGANCPFPHVFRGMPSFALAHEELNVRITQAAPAPVASRLRNALHTRAGLGLRLIPSQEQDGRFLGASVGGFLRDAAELDPALAEVPVGARLVRVNGVDASDQPFDDVLAHLRGLGLPLRLRFIYSPQSARRRRTALSSAVSGESESERQHLTSSDSSSGNSMPGENEKPRVAVSTDAHERSYSVADARRATSGLLGAVLSDLFGSGSGENSTSAGTGMESCGGVGSGSGKPRRETADGFVADSDSKLFSWDDVGGEARDLLTRGFYSPLSLSLLQELRGRRRQRRKALRTLPEYEDASSEESESEKDQEKQEKRWRFLAKRKAQGVWSTATGPMGLCWGACRLRDAEAAMLEVAPSFFSSRVELRGSEKRLRKGFVLVSINGESTFGASFATVMKRLATAARPTSLCLRWFRDYSPFLETELAEQSGKEKAGAPAAAKAFESALDCVAEAQTELSNSLQLALVENAAVRDQVAALQEAHRELRLAQERGLAREEVLQAKVAQGDAVEAELRAELEATRLELQHSRVQAQEAETRLAAGKQEQRVLLENAQEAAKARLAEHEEQLVKESNRSIENAKRLAERRTQQLLEAQAAETQRRHDEYLQKLAEEHSEEVESLMQQVAVWRHQVEVLTEAEKRNYAALVSNGVNPYQDFQRARFGYSSSDAPFADLADGSGDFGGSHRRQQSSASRRGGKTSAKAPEDAAAATAATAASWRDASPERGETAQHRFTESSDQSSQSNNGTFWDRMVSLLATE